MSKAPKKGARQIAAASTIANSPSQSEFDVVLGLIDAARKQTFSAVNATVVELYWRIGEFISRKVASEAWGKGTVSTLAAAIQRQYPGRTGYSASNLWRMSQFYETYRDRPKLATLLRELTWSHNLAILSRCKRPEEQEFYLRMTVRERWSFRELQRQLAGALFERVVMSPTKVSPPLTQLHPDAGLVFRDSYLVEFLDLPPGHSEADLQRGLVEQLKMFLIELGRDFCFVDKKLLQAKLHEFYELAQEQAAVPDIDFKKQAKSQPVRPRRGGKK